MPDSKLKGSCVRISVRPGSPQPRYGEVSVITSDSGQRQGTSVSMFLYETKHFPHLEVRLSSNHF